MFNVKEYFLFKKRGIILIKGSDRFSFIQGIISNDIELLRKKPSIYSSLLTPQGKFQYDFFISNFDDKFYLECDEGEQKELLNKLLIYKLRLNVEISIQSNLNVVLTKEKLNFPIKKVPNIISFYDPRFEKNFFSRTYIDSSLISMLEENFSRIDNSKYETLRLKHCIPDFSLDAIKHKSLLLEMRFDDLNGISWTKGCFMGQEITARMKYRNMTKRQIFKVLINFNNNLKNDIFFKEKVIGQLTSHNKKEGIAFIETKNLTELKTHNLFAGDSKLTIQKPWWTKS